MSSGAAVWQKCLQPRHSWLLLTSALLLPHASCPCAAARGLEYYRESASASDALSGYYATIGQIDEVGGRGALRCSVACRTSTIH